MSQPTSWKGLNLATPATYRIRVQGHIGSDWDDRFGGMTLTRETKAEDLKTTILLGHLPDQACRCSRWSASTNLKPEPVSHRHRKEVILGAFLFTQSQPIKNPGKKADSRRSAIQFSEVRFAWNPASGHVLDIPRLTIERSQHVFIAGPSGSGKSTLLSLMAGVSVPQTGQINVMGHRLEKMSGSARDRFRADHMGVIFQMFNLIPYLSVVENVVLPCWFSRRRAARTNANGGPESEAKRLLSQLGISDLLLQRPVTDLSVGQQQRVAAARALIGAPELIIADEPTSSLDAGHRRSFIRLLFEECNKANATLIFVSHDTALAPLFHRTVQLNAINRVAPVESTQEGGTQ